MSTFVLQRQRAATFDASGIVSAVHSLANRVHRAFAAYRLRRTLERMPDWALRDIGIPRGEIANEIERRLDAAGRSRGGYPF